MLPSEQGFVRGSVNHPGEAEQDRELMSCDAELDELNRGQTDQSQRVSYEMLDWVTRDHDYYSQDREDRWDYENAIRRYGLELRSSQELDFLIADQARENFENPLISDYTEVVYQGDNYEHQYYSAHPILLQASAYSENPIYEGQSCMNQAIEHFDYANQIQDSFSWISNQDNGFLIENRDNPPTYREHYAPATELSLDHQHQASQYGNANIQDSNIDAMAWNLESQGWNWLDNPMDLSKYRLATDQFDSGPSVMSESQMQCASSTGTLPGPSGTVTLENSRQGNVPEIDTEPRLKRRRKRSKMLAPSEDTCNAQPETQLNHFQQIRERQLLANFRPILPKPAEAQNQKKKNPEEDRINELRKKRRGWKCCSQTFNDYNLYKIHAESVHGQKDDPVAISQSAKQPTQKTKLLEAPESVAATSATESMPILCPFCLTNHHMLGPDVVTKPRWNGLNFLVCPLCHRWYKTLKQLKIHFCVHFRVRVEGDEKLPCRYCDRRFVLVSSLHKHEALCVAIQTERQNDDEGDNEQTARSRSTPKAVAGSAASPATTTAVATVSTTATPATAAKTAVAASSKAVATASSAADNAPSAGATTSTAFETKSTAVAASSKAVAILSTAVATAPSAGATTSAAFETKSTAVATTSPRVATASTASTSVSTTANPAAAATTTTTSASRGQPLFFCPDCGKLFTWFSSVKRHQKTIHSAGRNNIT